MGRYINTSKIFSIVEHDLADKNGVIYLMGDRLDFLTGYSRVCLEKDRLKHIRGSRQYIRIKRLYDK